MDRLILAVIFGGQSTEYGVSLQSAGAVIGAIDKSKYDVVTLGIDRSGDWFRFTGDADKIASDSWRDDACCNRAFISPSRGIHGIIELDGECVKITHVDAAFPVLHGRNGEDGTVQGLLELAGIPIIGCGTLSSALCMDKELAHAVAEAAGICVPRGVILRRREGAEIAVKRAHVLTYPVFVKPARAGSSFGITCVKRPDELYSAVQTAFEHDDKVIIEERIVGFEVGCAVMGDGDDLIFGAVDEIELIGDFFDFTEKYSLATAKIHVPARIPAQKAAEIKAAAGRVYRATGCSGFARADFFMTPAGQVVFNEVNTIPGFTEHSRFPNMMKAAGIPFEAMIDSLIKAAVRK